jgi:hypothetical protein
MPAKKKTLRKTTAAALKKTAAKAAPKKEAAPAKTVEVKKPEVKTEAVVKEAPKKEEVKKEPVKKTEPKKAEAKKAPAKKTTAKKAAPKKTAAKKTVKKAAPKKVVDPTLKTVKDYVDIINWKKGEAHAMDWLYIEINAGDLLTEVEAGKDNLAVVCKAILECMLEGDGYIVEPSEADKVNSSLTVRYYCDNLSADRKKFFE